MILLTPEDIDTKLQGIFDEDTDRYFDIQMSLDNIIKSDQQHRKHQQPQIYARIPFKLREKQKVD